jgi:hypothetical protein
MAAVHQPGANHLVIHSTGFERTDYTAVKNKRKTEPPYIFMPAALRRHLPRVLLILPLIK